MMKGNSMKLLRFIAGHEARVPLWALAFASTVCATLVCARAVWGRDIRHAFLIWNLFLAWSPLILALIAQQKHTVAERQPWRFGALTAAWLLFFPNSPYIFTDLIHLRWRFYGHYWVDLVLILMCALTGWFAGFLSLYFMHSIVSRANGRIAGWSFILVTAILSGFGVCVGRFLRFNSWDILIQPITLCHRIGAWAHESASSPILAALPLLFATFLFVTYVMFYALTHMSPARPPG